MKKQVTVLMKTGEKHSFKSVSAIEKHPDLILTMEDGSVFTKPFNEVDKVTITDMVNESKQGING